MCHNPVQLPPPTEDGTSGGWQNISEEVGREGEGQKIKSSLSCLAARSTKYFLRMATEAHVTSIVPRYKRHAAKHVNISLLHFFFQLASNDWKMSRYNTINHGCNQAQHKHHVLYVGARLAEQPLPAVGCAFISEYFRFV